MLNINYMDMFNSARQIKKWFWLGFNLLIMDNKKKYTNVRRHKTWSFSKEEDSIVVEDLEWDPYIQPLPNEIEKC